MRTNSFRVVPLATEVADDARRKAASGAVDHKISTVEDEGSAPCRHCLTWAKPGERVILFPYQSVAADRPYAESGPIFIHAEGCAPYGLPNEFPPEMRNGRAMRAYNAADEIVGAELVNVSAEETAEQLLQNPEVQYLHVRSASAGCYTFKIERA